MMGYLTSRKFMTPVLLAATLMAGVTINANAHVDELTALTPVGFSIHFGHQNDRHGHKYRKQRRYNSYGYGYSKRSPGYYQPYRSHKYDWSRHGYQYKHYGQRRTRRNWHKQH